MDVRVKFKIIEDSKNAPISSLFVWCHIIFDVNTEDFRRIYCLVDGGHMADNPDAMAYSSIISHDTICLDPVIAPLEDPEVKCGDVMNAYITSLIKENIRTTIGPKFVPDAGK